MNLLVLLLTAAAVFFLVRTLFFSRPGIGALEASQAIRAGSAVMVDVREPGEWLSGVAKPAVLLAFSDLRGNRSGWQPFLEKNRGKQIVVYCASGARSGAAAALLRREGHNAVNLGGLSRWAGVGLPTRRPH